MSEAADAEAVMGREVRAASGLIPELVSIVVDYAFGARFYVLRTDDSSVDDAQSRVSRKPFARIGWRVPTHARASAGARAHLSGRKMASDGETHGRKWHPGNQLGV